MDSAGVWLIIGVQASGKSTIASLLAERFERSVHIPGGEFYRWVTRGWIPMDKPEPPGARAHLDLRYRLSALVADEYARAGFAAIVQDNIYGDDVLNWLNRVTMRPRRLVVLRPRLHVVAAREDERKRVTGKIAYRPNSWTIEDLDAALGALPKIGLWVDNSESTPRDTAEEIMSRQGEALIDGTPPLTP